MPAGLSRLKGGERRCVCVPAHPCQAPRRLIGNYLHAVDTPVRIERDLPDLPAGVVLEEKAKTIDVGHEPAIGTDVDGILDPSGNTRHAAHHLQMAIEDDELLSLTIHDEDAPAP